MCGIGALKEVLQNIKHPRIMGVFSIFSRRLKTLKTRRISGSSLIRTHVEEGQGAFFNLIVEKREQQRRSPYEML